MKLGSGGLMKLSEMICSDSPFDYFPYRSSSYLTRFFIDLYYVHDGSTCRDWVNDVLKELNEKQELSSEMLSKKIVAVIEDLLHPDHFSFDEKVDREKAKEAVIKTLKTYDLTIVEQPNDLVKVCPLHGEFISTEYIAVPSEKLVTFKPSVFQVPEKPQNERLVFVMMPFNANFGGTYDAIKQVAEYMNLDCLRADDIWDNSTFMQDIFDTKNPTAIQSSHSDNYPVSDFIKKGTVNPLTISFDKSIKEVFIWRKPKLTSA